ncbi:MAG: hypothetical protein HOK61_13055 [Alphaproteobacteria bacterium]|jgi:hypothetical protein|nr:hypothetical protein [Alphaproteobacteria bacterium]
MSVVHITAFAEIFGAVAVLVTLIYLARQIKQNTEEIRSSNYHGITDSFNNLSQALAENAELAKVFRNGNENFDNLSDDEKTQFHFLMHATLRVMDVLHYQSRHGTGDQTLWDFEKHSIDAIFSTPGARSWWRWNPYSLSAEFTKYVDETVLPNSKGLE